MYQVLYRKYRPQTFEDVCGQTVIVKLLKNSIKNKKISHAYLFAGPRGTGKTSMAKIFARVINCENANELIPCGKCISCTQNTNDIIEIDAASNNGVDEIRELRNKVNLVPTTGKYKVYIIDEVHMLTTGAFNALLKTLEEPPAHVIFILATTDPHKIPETILSRCQRLDFKKISVDEIVGKLSEISQKEQIDVDDESLKEIAKIADGGLRDSISLLDEVSIFSNGKITKEDIHTINGTLTEEALIDFITCIMNKDFVKTFDKIEQYNKMGKNFVKLSEGIINCLKNVLIYLVAPDYFREIKGEDKKMENISQEISKDKLIRYIHEFNSCFNEMSKISNHKLLFELSVIKLLNENDNSDSKAIKKQDSDNRCNINDNLKGEQTEIKMFGEQKNVSSYTSQPERTKENIKSFPQEKNLEKSKQNKENVENYCGKLEEPIKVDEELLSHLRKIRINNTLSKFNKKLLSELRKQLENITGFLLDPNYSNCVSIILDGTLKASSDQNLIFVFNKKMISDDFNMNLLIVEELLERLFGKHYDVISTWDEEWEKIKEDFNGKKKKYIYKKEDFDLNEVLMPKKSDELNDLFGDIIEYS